MLLSLRLRDDGATRGRAGLRLPHAGVRRHHEPHGRPDGPPTKAGVSFVDFLGRLPRADGLLAALWEAGRTGKGRDVDVALMDGALFQLGYMATWALNCGYVPRKFSHSAHPSLVPAQNFRTKDGWVSVLCLKQDFFPVLAERMGMAALAEDARFRTARNRFDKPRGSPGNPARGVPEEDERGVDLPAPGTRPLRAGERRGAGDGGPPGSGAGDDRGRWSTRRRAR